MDNDRFAKLAQHAQHDAAPIEANVPLFSDFIVAGGKDDMAVFLRHTSELMFKLTPFDKDGDQYFKLTQFDEDEQNIANMYLCIGELEALQELLAGMIKRL